jgi:hypothetical protein
VCEFCVIVDFTVHDWATCPCAVSVEECTVVSLARYCRRAGNAGLEMNNIYKHSDIRYCIEWKSNVRYSDSNIV